MKSTKSSQKHLGPILHLLAFVCLLIQIHKPVETAQESKYIDVDHDDSINGNASEPFKIQRNAQPYNRLISSDADSNEHNAIASLVTGKNFFTKNQMDYAEQVMYKSEEAQGKLPISVYGYRAILAKLLNMAYPDMYVHRYDNYKELRESGGPLIDQEKCLAQLDHLVGRANANLKLGLKTKDINFYRLLDTFGRAPAGLFSGDLTWLGSYDSCLKMRIDLSGGDKSAARYCLTSLRMKSWPNDDKTLEQIAVFKSAVCLPKACDSVSYKNKYHLIQKLIEFNARKVDLNAATVSSIYCLPDEESNPRIWWKSNPTLISVSLISAWLALLIYSTYKDEKYRNNKYSNDNCMDETPADLKSSRNSHSLYRSLSITNNLRSLFSTEKASSMMQSADSRRSSITETSIGHRVDGRIVNLDMIEGIKVLAAIYVTCGHVMMISTGIIRNGQEMSDSTSISYNMSNLMPAFAVNAFFAITGILTAYLMFKQDQTHSFIRSPIKWLAFIFYRYLRIMPIYAIVTLFCKHIARYIGDGPLWDYGTSSLAARRNCEQESWAWTLLFGANFKSPLKHCIPSAWYLANDFQFSIVTPIFLAALHLKPKLGKRLIIASIVAGYVAGFWNVFSSAAYDIRPIALFMPHGFMTYITFLHDNYTRPQYRIPAYLVGLLLGHSLYIYERRRQEYLDKQQQQHQHQQQQEQNQQVEGEECQLDSKQRVDEDKINGQLLSDETDWSKNWFIRYGTAFLIFAAIMVIITPPIGSRLPLNKYFSRVLVAFIMPTYHLLYAFSIGNYILLATTGYGNKFFNGLLSMKFWKPLARLSLCVVLVNVEVIAYIIQSHKSMHSLTNQYHTCLNLLSILCTYLVATCVCVLFEAPIRAALNHMLASIMQGAAIKKKKST